MPTASILVLTAIVTVFVLFGAVVAFVDVYSRRPPSDHQPAE